MKRSVFWFALLLPACDAAGGDSIFVVEDDVPEEVDAGFAPIDTGVARDTGIVRPTDNGVVPRDLGSPVDAGFPVDVGFLVDNGFERDVGFPVDVGFPRDAGFALETGVTPGRTTVIAGRRCTVDGDCFGAASALACVTTIGGNVCTVGAGCDQGSVAAEEAACGGRYATCLVYSTPATGPQISLCSRACVSGARTEATGACPASSICTTNWLQLQTAQTEAPGCLPFCTSDADCAGALAGDASVMRCNTRLGRCTTAPVNPALRADGSLCNPMMIQSTGVAQCRGTCFSLSTARPAEGLCGSFINVRTAPAGCTDDPMMTPRGPMGDELGVCIFRECTNNVGCTGGSYCVYPEDASGVRRDAVPYCAYRTTLQPSGIP